MSFFILRILGKFLITVICMLQLNSVMAQQTDTLSSKPASTGHPVIFREDTVLFLYANLGPYSAEERSAAATARLNALLKDPFFHPDSLTLHEVDNNYDIRWKNRIILTITKNDASFQDREVTQVAEEYIQLIRKYLKKGKDATALKSRLIEIGLAILLVLAVILVVIISNWLFRFVKKWMRAKKNRFFKGIKIKSYELISGDREYKVSLQIIDIMKWVFLVFVLYLSLPLLFSIFPQTERIAKTITDYTIVPFKNIFFGILGYFPKLITIAIIFLVLKFFVRIVRTFAVNIESENLKIPGFYADWARPTFNITRFLIYIFGFIIIFPYLPGSDSPVFQGVSIFLGLLISLGSSSAISNIIAGLVITYMRPFKIGDRVKIGEAVGDVVEKNMLVTRLKTIKNEYVTIPNSSVLSGHTFNFSFSTEDIGLIIHSNVTIGYDVPWRKVHDLLIQAAKKTKKGLKEPPPFVLQKSLDDFYVSYEINLYINEPGKTAAIYSDLHQNIQDAFNEAGVEILSPHYRAARDGNQVTIPNDYLPKDYKAPSFNLNINNTHDGKNESPDK